jgi:hypothetical protein
MFEEDNLNDFEGGKSSDSPIDDSPEKTAVPFNKPSEPISSSSTLEDGNNSSGEEDNLMI